MRFPFYKQLDSMDCGPTALRMIAKNYGKSYSLPFLREKCYIDRAGVSLKGISEAAEAIGFRTLAVKVPLTPPYSVNMAVPSLKEAPLPCIVHWNQNHFVVLYKISKKYAWIADPGAGKIKLTHEEFNKSYKSDGENGVALLLEPTPDFYRDDLDDFSKRGFWFIFDYLRPHSRLMWQVFIGLMLGMVFQLIFPFLTQSLVDIGIDAQNLGFIYIVLAGQLMLFVGQISVRFIQSWIILHISVRINVNLIADFLIKLMKLPLGFFDSKNIGDLLQRIGDHKRVESFLTQSILSLILSISTLFVFGIVLAIYSTTIVFIFLIAAFLYITWIYIFLKKRKEVDYKAFQELSDTQDSLIEIIQGMPEIKLQGSQLKRRWKWAVIQAKLFRTQMRGLAIQYIVGQLNGPLNQLVGFIRAAQDASISLERLGEIHGNPDEEDTSISKVAEIPGGDIIISDLSFKYTPIGEEVLKKVNIQIPRGKTTAIVGTSGSGKTTLIKMLLGFYPPTGGKITIGSLSLDAIYQKSWRKHCGVVMQDGYIFSDTIANNIAESDDETDHQKVLSALETANLLDFVESLPLSLNTKIGAKGNGVSQGQRQRLLIARAVYKNPDFLFFDEATNALDANNEKIIMENLNNFLENRTAIVVAHRLSTVKNADQIIVLENGEVVEKGTHIELVKLKGHYYTLVKNQLELGN